MARLQFLLTSNTIAYRAENGSEEWVLLPDSVFQRNYERFDVVLGSTIYDGFGLEYSLKIKQRTPDDIAWAEKMSAYAEKASGGKVNAGPAEGCVGTIGVNWSIGHQIPPNFQIIVLLPADSFFSVQKNLEKYPCHMSLNTGVFEAGLAPGDDPNGNDLRWLVEKVQVAIIESISLRFNQANLSELPP